MSRVLTLIALLISTAAAADTRYTVILGGNKAGIQTSSVTPDGVREINFEFNDRGRGPKLTARIKVNDAGLPTQLQTSGNDYLKVPVKETFTLERGVARWENDAEKGEKQLNAPAVLPQPANNPGRDRTTRERPVASKRSHAASAARRAGDDPARRRDDSAVGPRLTPRDQLRDLRPGLRA
ncbi:hypothetical protein JM946_21075 [Steroidobacter sp. S1-65]|uniref:Uncharacterized protein n=1 Tax=Steroidobacter gossypii TaxID=2805490 RepID=A0ABS1X1W8_9GAMM|nr:hypothetical protein [Steroidobacter gossypii]MBM0107237.1 hypothetical protein [Steroidobacter gossypii]